MIITEKEFHRTTIKRILHTLCLIVPIGFAFLGYFFSESILNYFFKNKISELIKFLSSLIFFLIPSVFIFLSTRKENPILKMRVFGD